MEFKDRFNDYIYEKLDSYKKRCRRYKIGRKKVIHDPILGSNLFLPHEIALIDNPLMQRLRAIHQTSLCYYTFPSATHNRFEHSLGVCIWAGRMAESLCEKSTLLTDNYKKELRIASLLHDIGHGPFSHISEYLMKQNEKVVEILNDDCFKGMKPKPHEAFSYLIVNSPCFQDFLQEVKNIYNEDFSSLHLGDLIIGKPYEFKNKFKSQILNGAVDADKIDYILRDAYTTGLKLVLDVDRFLYQIFIEEKKDGTNELMLDISGISPMEQILFSKMLLFTNMYHHQKVRASDCMIISLLEIALDKKVKFYGSTLDVYCSPFVKTHFAQN